MLKQTIQEFLEGHDLLGRSKEAHFVVAFSGGRDSTALLYAMDELRREHSVEITLSAAYYWHPWRPLQHDLAIVHRHCKALQVQWFQLTPDLNLPTNEASARGDRYQQLSRLAHDLKATAILTGHHQDDQIETMLFRMFRGTGIDGLSGIPEVRLIPLDEFHNMPVARPFIEQPRTVINQYAEERQLTFVDDPTNTETRLKRNYIRHELLPRIEEAFPMARKSLVRLGHLTAGDMEVITHKIDEIWLELYEPTDQSMDEARFNQLLRPFQRRIIRKYLHQVVDMEVSYSKVEEVLDFIAGKNRNLHVPALHSLTSNRFLSIYRSRIKVEEPQKMEVEPLPIAVPSEVSHRQLRATLSIVPVPFDPAALRNLDVTKFSGDEVYVDLSHYKDKPLVLRTRRQGDRITPLGMEQAMRLKKFFINRCIPRFERDQIPLLATDEEVLWAVGVGISDKIRVSNRPTHILRLKKDT